MSIITDLTLLYNTLKNERKEAITAADYTPDFFRGRGEAIWEIEESLRKLLVTHGADPQSVDNSPPSPEP
jgi:hypothetical protein